MATISANRTKAGAFEASHRQKLFGSEGKISRVHGPVLLKFSRTLTSAQVADFDDANDVLEFGPLPDNSWVVGVYATGPDLDTHATPTVTVQALVGSQALGAKVTPATGILANSMATGFYPASGATVNLKIVDAPATAATAYATPFEVTVLAFIGAPTVV